MKVSLHKINTSMVLDLATGYGVIIFVVNWILMLPHSVCLAEIKHFKSFE